MQEYCLRSQWKAQLEWVAWRDGRRSGDSLSSLPNSLPDQKNSLPGRRKFPAGQHREFGKGTLKANGFLEGFLAESVKKRGIPCQIPNGREFGRPAHPTFPSTARGKLAV